MNLTTCEYRTMYIFVYEAPYGRTVTVKWRHVVYIYTFKPLINTGKNNQNQTYKFF